MKTIVVYESRFGNTERIARAIAAGLEAAGPVSLVRATDGSTLDVDGVDLLVVGGPTEGHGVSPTFRAWLAQLPPNALNGVAAASFDTRLRWPAFLSGSAARGIAKTLQKKGARLVAPPESFLVDSARESALLEGESERASGWAAKIAADLSAVGKVAS